MPYVDQSILDGLERRSKVLEKHAPAIRRLLGDAAEVARIGELEMMSAYLRGLEDAGYRAALDAGVVTHVGWKIAAEKQAQVVAQTERDLEELDAVIPE
ncbi:hypothetical protein [Streptomyces buecherae]|uniref:hypothetical protein n=1 Tax=Streptomyces buecherae TaxID=2763006 RepID=UPI00164E8ABA|nr:hypothetical protein [Streptomyces buecherae]QNJ42012.1 hypothetical protein H7H31_21260 [Streptomyces buecherae]